MCTSKPYDVKAMNQEEIHNFTTQLGSAYSNLITNKLRDTKGSPHKVKWSSQRHVCLQRPSGNEIKMLYTYYLKTSCCNRHCVKSAQIRSFFWSKYRKIRATKISVFGHFSLSEETWKNPIPKDPHLMKQI